MNRCLIALALLAASVLRSVAEPVKELGDAVGKEFVDPTKHERVVFDFTLRGVWGDSTEVRMPGWREAKSGALFLDDGFAVSKPEQRNVEASNLEKTLPPVENDKKANRFSEMELVAQGMGGEARIPHAAWIAASGDFKRASELLNTVKAGKEETFLALWQGERIWFHFAAMVHAYMQGEDDVAIAHGRFSRSALPQAHAGRAAPGIRSPC